MKNYQKIIAIVLLGSFLLNSCSSVKKPKPFIKADKMTDILVQMRIVEAQIYQKNVELKKSDSLGIIVKQAYAQIFDEYKLSPSEFDKNMTYYVKNPNELEAIYKDVDARLKQKLQSDSIIH